MSAAATLPGLPDRLGVILAGMRRVLAVRAGRDRATAAMVLILWHRLGRLLARVTAVAARYHAGTLLPPTHPRRPASPPPPPPPDPLPRHRAWLLLHAPECAAYGEQLRQLLAEPEVAVMIEAAPQLRRLLRPLWRMLQPEPPPPVLTTVLQPLPSADGQPPPQALPAEPAAVPVASSPAPVDGPMSSHRPPLAHPA